MYATSVHIVDYRSMTFDGVLIYGLCCSPIYWKAWSVTCWVVVTEATACKHVQADQPRQVGTAAFCPRGGAETLVRDVDQ
jgi:hypothetical protein